ncbi:uncharacterized protein N7503_003459 [Penicillium pulvis]|uniref:uncharacterized protein n=1 Tax=Penicillium pulvis TaxID=1562058 RepID=UPI00254843BC|nr:uncharacterized protein N7503_003459 [Penicillium pulvis]KAJ5805857.1 hypothetical protein N7503_003459 [Penicillium pulvis]
MERKLSQKAAQMRQRLFTRNLHSRGRAATMNFSEPTPSTSSSRSRSATTPVSSHPTGITLDTEPTRYYHFTDEPGYFCPVEPLIDRQYIEEDLEDNVKHSCGLLVESIERGLPIWPSFHTEQNGAIQVPHESRPQFQGVMAQLSLSPVAIDNHVPNEWDFGLEDLPSPKSTKYQGSLSAMSASAGTGRFYGKRLSTPPPEEEEFEGRPRGRSIATETTSRSRSRSSSPGFFPYSPPQFETTWGRDDTQIVGSPIDHFPESDFLGAEGTTWLSALDIPTDSEHWTSSSAVHLPKDRNCMTSVPNSAVEPGPAPRRFYSTRQKTRPVQLRESKWEAFELHGSRESGLYRGLSMGNLRQEKSPSNFSYPVWGKDGDIPVSLGGFYDVSDVPTRHRRKRAQELLKKLTGLGMKKKEGGMVEGRRAVAAMA